MTYPPNETVQRTLSLYRSVGAPCPYLQNLEAQNDFTMFDRSDKALLSALITQGFRRSDEILYRPACKNCSACTPCRINIKDFDLNKKSIKRIHNKNKYLTRHVLKNEDTDNLDSVLYALFQRYQDDRHQDGGMDKMDQEAFDHLISLSPTTEIWTYSDKDNQIQGAIILDLLQDGCSAVYSFYNPGKNADSLGKYLIYECVRILKENDKPYLYLGYWIKNAPKMSYKISFDAVEILNEGIWSYPDKELIMDGA